MNICVLARRFVNIELERPRNCVALSSDPLYNQYRKAVLSFLYERQARSSRPSR